MALNTYISITRQLINDPAGQRYTDANLTTFINIGRSQLALQGECVRFVYGLDGILFTGTFTASSTSVTSVSPAASAVSDTITGWVSAQTNNSMAVGTTVSSYAGTTMVLSAAATVSGTYAFVMGPPNVTVANQEVYSSPTSICATNGVKDVIGIRGVTVSWGSYGADQYTGIFADWSLFQAQARQYTYLSGNPWYWTRYENKQNMIYLRPIPSAAYPMQWDCTCSVVPLTDDTTPEAIPYSYTDAIPYFAAYLALMQSQRPQDAQNMLQIYNQFTNVGRRNFQSTMAPNIYDTV